MSKTYKSKTYKKDSMHNKYAAKWATMNLRIEQELRVKIERYAERHSLGLMEACRQILSEAVNDVLLTSDDYALIAERMRINEERNRNRE